MLMNGVKQIVHEVVITYFKVLSSKLSEGAKENHEKLHLGQLIIWTTFKVPPKYKSTPTYQVVVCI
jgi:hypothetical protein